MKKLIIQTLQANIGNFVQVMSKHDNFKGSGDLLSFKVKRKKIQLHLRDNDNDQYFLNYDFNNDRIRISNQPLEKRLSDCSDIIHGKSE